MRIGIDIDGVLTDLDSFQFDFFSKFCVENKIPYNIKTSKYDISKSFGLGDAEENKFWDIYLDYYAKQERARRFASEVIKKLKEEGHEVYIITARWLTNRDDALGENMRNTVKKWLDENDIVYDKLIFSKAKKEKKIDEIRENNIDVMIEDSPSNINELSKIIPVVCFDASYNKKCKGENIHRCFSWYDVYNKINQLSKQKYNEEECIQNI